MDVSTTTHVNTLIQTMDECLHDDGCIQVTMDA